MAALARREQDLKTPTDRSPRPLTTSIFADSKLLSSIGSYRPMNYSLAR